MINPSDQVPSERESKGTKWESKGREVIKMQAAAAESR